MNYSQITDRLYAMKDEKYQKFSSSLIPGNQNMIGVRLPALKELAKEIGKDNPLEFLENAKDDSFEEIMLQGFVIGQIKDFDKVLMLCRNHIPKITNWSLCDSFVMCLKIFGKHKSEVFSFIQPYLHSESTYDVRFAVVVLLDYFVDKEHIRELFPIFDSIDNGDYYVKMAVAWAISVCFVKFPDETAEYLNNCSLSYDVIKKSLQKIRESRRTDTEKLKLIKINKTKINKSEV